MKRVGWAALAVAGGLAVASAASADVRHAGAWPEKEKPVVLDVEAMPRSQALRKLADVAGWSLVVHAPTDNPVSLHIKNEPPSRVLDLMFADDHYVATRDGNIVAIDREAAPATAASEAASATAPATATATATAPASVATPAPVAPPAPVERGKDRSVAGGHMRIEKNEVAHDVSVLGGNADIYGIVTGQISVMGGNVVVHEGAEVRGGASLLGGNLEVRDGARLDGEVTVMGGALKRGPKAQIGGPVTSKGGSIKEIGSTPKDIKVAIDLDDDDEKEHGASAHRSTIGRMLRALGGSLASAAMLFVVGCVLIALAGRRVDAVKGEVAARPMRSFALGIVGIIGAVVAFIALCITLVGIPVAIIGIILAAFLVYGSVCAVLALTGEALIKHKTKNPYMHLALGCALYMLFAPIPYVGGVMVTILVLVSIGSLVGTRGAGLFAKKNGHPYRDPADAPQA